MNRKLGMHNMFQLGVLKPQLKDGSGGEDSSYVE